MSEEEETSEVLMSHGIDPIDVFILQKLDDKTYGWEFRQNLKPEEKADYEKYQRRPWLAEGASITTLHNVINEELGDYIDKKLTRPEVEKRIEALADKGLLSRQHRICVDPLKLFDNVFLLYLKVPISSPLRVTEIGWLSAVDKIWKADKEWKDDYGRRFDLTRLIGVVEGTGEYDVVLLVFTNNMHKVSRFLEKLKEKGYVDKSMTQRIWPPGGMRFDPITLPDFFTYARSVDKRKRTLDGFERVDVKKMPRI